MKINPFNIMYGTIPESIIERRDEVQNIIESFTTYDNLKMFFITGIRGCGKTVLLRKVNTLLRTFNDWLIIDLNPQSDILTSLSEKLYYLLKNEDLIEGWKISFNLGALTITKEENHQMTNPEIIIEDLLKIIIKKKKKLLINIDEVNNSMEFRKFVNYYQILIGQNYPVYLLLTGIYENTLDIMNDKATTFLTRAPKIELTPLPLSSIALEYQTILNIKEKDAIEMAKLTYGYAFAYQVLGFLSFKYQKKTIDEHLLFEYRKYLWNNGYSKFWYDLSQNEKDFLVALANSNGEKQDILEHLTMSKSNFSQYRKRLLDKGLIIGKAYDKLGFVLPQFKEFIRFCNELEN